MWAMYTCASVGLRSIGAPHQHRNRPLSSCVGIRQPLSHISVFQSSLRLADWRRWWSGHRVGITQILNELAKYRHSCAQLRIYTKAIRDICSEGEYAMTSWKLVSGALLFVTVGSLTSGASAITAEVAKKCGALTAKAFPPRVIGNPAAGSEKGSGKDEQAYFNKCVKNGGKVDDGGSKEAK